MRARVRLLWPGVAMVVAALVLTACGASSPEAPARAVLAGSTTDETGSTQDAEIDPMPTDGQTPAGGEPWDATATERCEAAVGAGLTQVAQSADETGVTTFWTKGSRWAVCDVVEGADPSVIQGLSKVRGFDEQVLAVDTAVVPASEGAGEAVRIVAGGPLPWRVEEIGYRFPDGHTETARFVTGITGGGDGWWTVTHTATDDVLVDPGTAATEVDPVTISVVGGAAEAFRVPWEDLQRNE